MSVVAVVDRLGMGGIAYHDELVHGYRGDPEEDAGYDHGDDAGNPAQHAERPRLRHDGETDLVAGEQPGGLLPGHGAELDLMSLDLTLAG